LRVPSDQICAKKIDYNFSSFPVKLRYFELISTVNSSQVNPVIQ
jgi:hypothetical protein